MKRLPDANRHGILLLNGESGFNLTKTRAQGRQQLKILQKGLLGS